MLYLKVLCIFITLHVINWKGTEMYIKGPLNIFQIIKDDL